MGGSAEFKIVVTCLWNAEKSGVRGYTTIVNRGLQFVDLLTLISIFMFSFYTDSETYCELRIDSIDLGGKASYLHIINKIQNLYYSYPGDSL